MHQLGMSPAGQRTRRRCFEPPFHAHLRGRTRSGLPLCAIYPVASTLTGYVRLPGHAEHSGSHQLAGRIFSARVTVRAASPTFHGIETKPLHRAQSSCCILATVSLGNFWWEKTGVPGSRGLMIRGSEDPRGRGYREPGRKLSGKFCRVCPHYRNCAATANPGSFPGGRVGGGRVL